LAGLLASAGASGACGQALERHLPPPEAPKAEAPPAPEAPAANADATPLGAALRRLVLLGPTGVVVTGAGEAGVDAHEVPRLDNEPARARLARFLGRPLSRQLIAGIEAAIVRDYRAMGHPFVQVSTPEQEIDTGVLQIRVVEFHLGRIGVAGAASPAEAAHITGQLRIRPGEPIDSPQLLQDFDWLSRYPFRAVTPAFTPGAALAETDLDLKVADARPWQVSAGYSNSGTAATGWDRYFIAASVGVPRLNDLVLSMQVTGSPDFWARQWIPFDDGHPAYKSAAARITAPTVARQAVEVTLDAVASTETVRRFITVRQTTYEASVDYKSALSNFVPLPGDGAVGVEAARQSRATLFDTLRLPPMTADTFQVFGEWTDRWSDPFGRNWIDVKAHVSPGGIDPHNTTRNLFDFTAGRVTSALYAYGELNFTRWSNLPHGFGLSSALTAQYAGRAIPDPQQLVVGGVGAVRGYSLDDGAFDDGVFLRNELHAPPVPTLGPGLRIVFSPMLFVDAGYGRDEAARRGVSMASVGLGSDVQITRLVAGGLTVSCPLTDARDTHAGAWRLDARVTVTY
jgi:hemolysin activation/secretion protein